MIRGILLTIVIFLILRLPGIYRDIMLIGFAVLCIILAMFKFKSVWITFLLLLPSISLGTSIFGQPKVTILRVLLLGFTILFIITKKSSWFIKSLSKSNGFCCFGLFVFANLLSAIHAWNIEAFYRAATYLEPLLFYVLSYYLVVKSSDNLPKILRAIILGGIIVGTIGVFEVAIQQSIFSFLNVCNDNNVMAYYDEDRFGLGGRISSLIANPVYASIYLIVVLIVSLHYVNVYKRSKLIQLILILAGIFLVLATGTRAAIFSLLAASICFVIFSVGRVNGYRAFSLAMVFAALTVSIIMPNVMLYLDFSFLLDVREVASRNVMGRLILTQEFIEIFRENFIFGYGPGLIQKEGLSGYLPAVPGIETLGGLENQYATILADGGIIAGFTYLLFMVSVIWQSLKMRNHQNPKIRWAGLTLLSLFTAYFTFAVSATTLTLIPNLILMGTYGALFAQYDREMFAKSSFLETSINPNRGTHIFPDQKG